jgi:hypothetical protein
MELKTLSPCSYKSGPEPVLRESDPFPVLRPICMIHINNILNIFIWNVMFSPGSTIDILFERSVYPMRTACYGVRILLDVLTPVDKILCEGCKL